MRYSFVLSRTCHWLRCPGIYAGAGRYLGFCRRIHTHCPLGQPGKYGLQHECRHSPGTGGQPGLPAVSPCGLSGKHRPGPGVCSRLRHGCARRGPGHRHCHVLLLDFQHPVHKARLSPSEAYRFPKASKGPPGKRNTSHRAASGIKQLHLFHRAYPAPVIGQPSGLCLYGRMGSGHPDQQHCKHGHHVLFQRGHHIFRSEPGSGKLRLSEKRRNQDSPVFRPGNRCRRLPHGSQLPPCDWILHTGSGCGGHRCALCIHRAALCLVLCGAQLYYLLYQWMQGIYYKYNYGSCIRSYKISLPHLFNHSLLL